MPFRKALEEQRVRGILGASAHAALPGHRGAEAPGESRKCTRLAPIVMHHSDEGTR